MGTKMDARKYIRIRGANENNLKNIDVDIPRNELVVLTGLSGSGKSSLAFDTIYAEGQRRYMESLSSYARQFLGQMEKPDVESIEGLSPAILSASSQYSFCDVYWSQATIAQRSMSISSLGRRISAGENPKSFIFSPPSVIITCNEESGYYWRRSSR